MRLLVAEASGTITTNELVESARNHFSGDRTFMADFTEEMLVPSLRTIALDALAETRKAAPVAKEDSVKLSSGERIRLKDIQEQRKRIQKLMGWRERVPIKGGHMLLTDMTRADLLSAASDRTGRAHDELVKAKTWETLAARMTSDTATVGEQFRLEEIDQIFESLRGERG